MSLAASNQTWDYSLSPFLGIQFTHDSSDFKRLNSYIHDSFQSHERRARKNGITQLKDSTEWEIQRIRRAKRRIVIYTSHNSQVKIDVFRDLNPYGCFNFDAVINSKWPTLDSYTSLAQEGADPRDGGLHGLRGRRRRGGRVAPHGQDGAPGSLRVAPQLESFANQGGNSTSKIPQFPRVPLGYIYCYLAASGRDSGFRWLHSAV